MTLKQHKKTLGSWTEPKPEIDFGGYARNPELDPNYMNYLEEEDYIPTQVDPDMEIIKRGLKDEDF